MAAPSRGVRPNERKVRTEEEPDERRARRKKSRTEEEPDGRGARRKRSQTEEDPDGRRAGRKKSRTEEPPGDNPTRLRLQMQPVPETETVPLART